MTLEDLVAIHKLLSQSCVVEADRDRLKEAFLEFRKTTELGSLESYMCGLCLLEISNLEDHEL